MISLRGLVLTGAAVLCLATTAFLASAGPSRAADGETVDCSDTSMEMLGKVKSAECKRYKETASLTEVSGGAVTDLIIAELPGAFLIAYDSRVLHQYIYFNRVSLRDAVDDIAKGMTDWKPGDPHNEFDTGEFLSGGEHLPCVGFRRYVTFSGREVKRYVVGFACSTGGNRENAYEALKNFDAPGD